MRSIAKTLSRIGNVAAIGALVFMFCHIILEIVLRNVFSKSTFVLDEFVGYAVSGLTFLALGETLRKGRLIRVTLLVDAVPLKVRQAMEIFGFASAFGVGAFGAWYIGKSVVRSFERGTTSSSIAEIPQWIPESFVLLGLCIFSLQAFVAIFSVTSHSEEAA
jgi:TRAP-type C4-dicarboxylate transport system permease small subunit